MRIVFGYRHVQGIPPCPCRDPGDYMSMEEDEDDVLHVVFRCWCGRKNEGRFDSMEERAEFLAKNGVESPQ